MPDAIEIVSGMIRVPVGEGVCGLRGSLFFGDGEINFAAHHFFERDARRLVPLRIHFDAWTRAALKLLATLRRNDNHAVFGINHGRLCFRRRFSFHFALCLDSFCHISQNPAREAGLLITLELVYVKFTKPEKHSTHLRRLHLRESRQHAARNPLLTLAPRTLCVDD